MPLEIDGPKGVTDAYRDGWDAALGGRCLAFAGFTVNDNAPRCGLKASHAGDHYDNDERLSFSIGHSKAPDIERAQP